MSEVVNLGSFDACNAEVAVDGSSDVADEEWVTGFGDEESGVFCLWPVFHVHLDCFFGGFVERDAASIVALIGTDLESAGFESDVLELDAS